MKTVKEHNEEMRKKRYDLKQRRIKRYGDDRIRVANVICDVCHAAGKDVEVVLTTGVYPTSPFMRVVQCPECELEMGLDF